MQASLLQKEHLLRSAKNNLCGHPGEIVLGVALLRFRAISQLMLAQNIFLSISLRRSFCKWLKLFTIYQLEGEIFFGFIAKTPDRAAGWGICN